MTTNHLLEHAARLEALRQRRVEIAPPTLAPAKPAKLDYTAILNTWWASMAPAVRNHPWSLEVIAAAAFKDQPRRPALRFIAAALEQMGWAARRDWTRAGRNRRLWTPPTN